MHTFYRRMMRGRDDDGAYMGTTVSGRGEGNRLDGKRASKVKMRTVRCGI